MGRTCGSSTRAESVNSAFNAAAPTSALPAPTAPGQRHHLPRAQSQVASLDAAAPSDLLVVESTHHVRHHRVAERAAVARAACARPGVPRRVTRRPPLCPRRAGGVSVPRCGLATRTRGATRRETRRPRATGKKPRERMCASGVRCHGPAPPAPASPSDSRPPLPGGAPAAPEPRLSPERSAAASGAPRDAGVCNAGVGATAPLGPPPPLLLPTICPISTEGWTRRVHFVREGGRGGPAAHHLAIGQLCQRRLPPPRHARPRPPAPRLHAAPRGPRAASCTRPRAPRDGGRRGLLARPRALALNLLLRGRRAVTRAPSRGGGPASGAGAAL
jgi:hypothetical protein